VNHHHLESNLIGIFALHMGFKGALLARLPERVWLKPMATGVSAPFTSGKREAEAQPPRITRVVEVQRFKPVASAAQVAGLPLSRFLEILSSLKIPVVEGGSAELQEDLANARLWLNGAP